MFCKNDEMKLEQNNDDPQKIKIKKIIDNQKDEKLEWTGEGSNWQNKVTELIELIELTELTELTELAELTKLTE